MVLAGVRLELMDSVVTVFMISEAWKSILRHALIVNQRA